MMTNRNSLNGKLHSEKPANNPKATIVSIQRLQQMVSSGSPISEEERKYLETNSTNGVRSYLRRRYKTEEVDRYILSYGTRALLLPEKDLNVTAVCFQIQFSFDLFKTWLSRHFPNRH